MTSFLLALLISASGDPLVDFPSTQYTLTAGQITLMTGWLASNWPTLNINNLVNVQCTPTDTCAMKCSPMTNEPPAIGSDIRSLLLSMIAWTPASTAIRQLVWPGVCLSGTALTGFYSFVQSTVTEVGSQTVRNMTTVQQPAGTFLMSAHYARSMSAADCATYSSIFLQPLGVTP